MVAVSAGLVQAPLNHDRGGPASPKLCYGQTVLLESFCRKQSAFWRVWRVRWLVLTPDALLSFREKRGYTRGHKPTELALRRPGSACAAACPM